MTKVVEQEILRAATIQHNQFVKATGKGMKAQRNEALAELTTPAYSVTHGFREVVTGKEKTTDGGGRKDDEEPVQPDARLPPQAENAITKDTMDSLGNAGATDDAIQPLQPDAIHPAQAGIIINKDTVDSPEDGGVTDEGGRKDDEEPIQPDGIQPPGQGDAEVAGQPDTGLPAKEQSAINSDISDSTGSQQQVEEQGKEVVTAAGTNTPPPPPPPDSGQEIGNGAATGPLLTVADLKKLWKEATAKEKEEKKRLKEKSDLKQKRLREARAELKEAIQAARKKPKLEPKEPKLEPKEHDPLDSNEDASSSSDDEGEHTGKSVRKRLTQVEKWANGHKAILERQHCLFRQRH